MITHMRPSVETAWPVMARDHEGVLPFMYLDTLNFLTIGIGTLMDAPTAPEEILTLPWFHKTSKVWATDSHIALEYEVVQNRPDLSPKGGSAFADITDLRIGDNTINGLLWGDTLWIWERLIQNIPAIPNWPADAQLAILGHGLQSRTELPQRGAIFSFVDPIKTANFDALSELCMAYSTHRRWQNRAKLWINAELVVGTQDYDILWGLFKTPPITPEVPGVALTLTPEDLKAVAKAVLEAPLYDDIAHNWTTVGYQIRRARVDANFSRVQTDTVEGVLGRQSAILEQIVGEVDEVEEFSQRRT